MDINGQNQTDKDKQPSGSIHRKQEQGKSEEEEEEYIQNDNDDQNENVEKRQTEKEEKEENGENGDNKLSKKQIKKQLKRQKWEELKKIKRKEQREKQKEKRKQKREELKPEMAEQKQEVDEDGEKVQKMTRKRKDEYREKMADGLKVVIDLQFYDLMSEKEQASLGKQMAYCHSTNRKSERPFHYIVTSFTDPRREFMGTKYSIQNYGITLEPKNMLDVFPHDKIVYLTGDAEEELEEFDPEEVYIIGGIVDHNRLKNITINYAMQNKLKARRLPMSGLKLKASVHLAVNHVWEWMLRHYNGSSWKEAIQAVIPERKLQEGEK